MEKKVRLFCAIIVPALLFVLFTVSYQSYLPQQNVIELLDHYQSLQYDSENIAIRLETDSTVETVFLNKVLSTMNYKILDSRVEGDNAIVSLQISNINLDDILNNYEANLVEQTIKSVENEKIEAVSHIDDFEISLLVNLIDDPNIEKEYVSQEIDLNLHKDNGKWVLEDSDEFFKAIMGCQSDQITFEHLKREVK